jgi:hypothetical protein
MDVPRRSSRISRKERIRNVNYKATNWTRGNNCKKIEQNQLTWGGHVQRMVEGR